MSQRTPNSGRPRSRRPRLVYLAGPIDAERVILEYQQKDSSSYGTVYFAQLIDIVERLDIDGLIISTNPGLPSQKQAGRWTIVNHPMPEGRRGIAYHAAMAFWMRKVSIIARRFDANILVATAGQNYFWALGTPISDPAGMMACLHCTLWPRTIRPKLAHALLVKLGGKLFYDRCSHIQCAAPSVADQVRQVTSTSDLRPKVFWPSYPPTRFEAVTSPTFPAPTEPFRLLFLGRIERNKGVFDLLDMLEELHRSGGRRYEIDVCGDGSESAALASAIVDRRMSDCVRYHGQCDGKAIASLYAKAHAGIVPTRSDFEEGYAQTAAEAVLNLRPLITSNAVPASDDLSAAAMIARVDDVIDYVRQIRALSSDRALYETKVAGAHQVREIYFDTARSYGAVLEPAIRNAIGEEPDKS